MAASPRVSRTGMKGAAAIKVLKRENGMVVLRFDTGEQFPEALGEWCQSENLQSAAILCGIGMLRSIEIGLYDGKEYTRREIEGPSEVLSLQGSVSMKEGIPFVHLHTSVAGHDFSASGGHLFSAEVYMTIELVLMELTPGLVRKPVGGAFWQIDTE